MRTVLTAVLFTSLMSLTGPAEANLGAVTVVNDYRAQAGLSPLSHSRKLERAAHRHARDMARRGFFSHKGSNGSNVAQRVRATGYDYCFVAENIAMGQQSLGEVMQAWVTSKGHRKNILDRRASDVAVVKADSNIWVMVLGRSDC